MARDDCRGNKKWELRAGDFKTPNGAEITINSAAGANDEWLPYNSTIDGIDTIWTEDRDGTTVSGIINGTPTISNNILEINMDYPTNLGEGNYILWCTVDYTVAAVARKKTLKFARIKVY